MYVCIHTHTYSHMYLHIFSGKTYTSTNERVTDTHEQHKHIHKFIREYIKYVNTCA